MSRLTARERVRCTQQQLYRAERQLVHWRKVHEHGPVREESAFAQGTVLALMLAYRCWLSELCGSLEFSAPLDSAEQACRLWVDGCVVPELAELAQLERDPHGWPARLLSGYARIWFGRQESMVLLSDQSAEELTIPELEQMIQAMKAMAERFRQAQIPY